MRVFILLICSVWTLDTLADFVYQVRAPDADEEESDVVGNTPSPTRSETEEHFDTVPERYPDYHDDVRDVTILTTPGQLWDAIHTHDVVAVLVRSSVSRCGEHCLRAHGAYRVLPGSSAEWNPTSPTRKYKVAFFVLDVRSKVMRELLEDVVMESPATVVDHMAPSLLLCKHRLMAEPRRPPVVLYYHETTFLTTAQVTLQRLLHPDNVILAHTVDDISRYVYPRRHGSLVAALWSGTGRHTFEAVAHDLRKDVLFLDITGAHHHHADREYYNPDNGDIVTYLYDPEFGHSSLIINATNATDYASIVSFIQSVRRINARHAVPAKRDYEVWNVHRSMGCLSPAAFGDDVEVSMLGVELPLMQQFLFNTSKERVQIGHELHVVEGVQRALEGMCIGDTRQVVVPPEMGYGKKGHPPYVTGGATLLITVTLHTIYSHDEI